MTLGQGGATTVGNATGAVIIAAGTKSGSHLRSTQTTPPLLTASGDFTATTSADCENGAGTNSLCTDMRGRVVITADADGGAAIVTFDKTYAIAPVCVISPGDAEAAANLIKTVTTNDISVTASATAMTITYGAGTYNATEDTWNYICIE